jgi:hypothetical protein
LPVGYHALAANAGTPALVVSPELGPLVSRSGLDRLIPIWLTTLGHKQKHRIVHFDSPTQLLTISISQKDGARYRRIRAAFQRFFSATVFFGTEDGLKKQILVDTARFHFLDQMEPWFNRNNESEPLESHTLDNVLVLSEPFLPVQR